MTSCIYHEIVYVSKKERDLKEFAAKFKKDRGMLQFIKYKIVKIEKQLKIYRLIADQHASQIDELKTLLIGLHGVAIALQSS